MAFKISEDICCPYCNKTNYRTFAIDTENMDCPYCGKEFSVKLSITAIVKCFRLPIKECIFCGKTFDNEFLVDCPDCKIPLFYIE